MTTLRERPERAESPATAPGEGRIRTLTMAVIVLAVGVIALGARVVYDLAVTPDTGITPEVQVVFDDYIAAWNNGDADAFLGVVADDYTFEVRGLQAESSKEDVARNFPTESGFQVEIQGEPLMIGDGPLYYLVSVDNITEGGIARTGISHYEIVDVGGDVKIQSHVIVIR